MQWFRFYSEALDDPKVQRLPGDLFKAWVNLMCLANEQDERGTLPDIEDIAFRLRIDEVAAVDLVAELVRRQLLEYHAFNRLVIHAWWKRQKKSDNVGERVAGWRERNKQRSTDEDETIPPADVTLHETTLQQDSNALDKNREEKRREDPTPLTPLPGGGEAASTVVQLHPAPKPTTLDDEQQSRFDRWYAAYPRHEHRPEAERAWRKHDPDDAMTDRLIADVQRRKGGRKWGEGFVELPATYLNQRAWEDDIEPLRLRHPTQADINSAKHGRPVI